MSVGGPTVKIVEECGIPMGSIGVLLQRSLKKLRKIIAKNPKIYERIEGVFTMSSIENDRFFGFGAKSHGG
jgi:hypothetical protein